MKRISRHQTTGPESGFTLIELLVSMGLAVLVLLVVGGFMISSSHTERDVRSATEASTAGQLVVRSVQAGVRNASRVALTEISDEQMLVVRTAGGGTPVEWACQAWYYVPEGGGTLYMKRVAPAVKIEPPTAVELDSWTLLADGISMTNTKIFEAILGRVTIKLDVDGGPLGAVSINSTATMRILPNTEPKCFEE